MNEDGFIIRAFNRLVRLLAASPLAALVLGLFVLFSGSAVCEYYMITLGRETDVYYPWMSGTVVLGLLIWSAFFWRCLDFSNPTHIQKNLHCGFVHFEDLTGHVLLSVFDNVN